MNEADFWASLEYRVGREFSGMPDKRLQGLWCDGFIPERYLLNEDRARVVGRAWICEGSQQYEYEFTLILPQTVASRDAIDWASLLPAENVTRWLSLDQRRERIEIEPAVAVPDRPQSRRP